MANVRQWFDAIDADRSGSLSCPELQRALQMGNLNYSLVDVDQMIRAFDANGNRALTFDEFARLHYFLVNVQNSFTQFDISRRGRLAPQDFDMALRQAGFTLDQPALLALMKKYDADGTGALTLDEFIRACLFLQTGARVFQAFDPQRRGVIQLNFNQFVYACSNTSF